MARPFSLRRAAEAAAAGRHSSLPHSLEEGVAECAIRLRRTIEVFDSLFGWPQKAQKTQKGSVVFLCFMCLLWPTRCD